MDLARYVVDAVVLEGRSYREVAAAHGVSKSYVAKLVGRFQEGGYAAIGPRSRAPKRIPHRTPDVLEALTWVFARHALHALSQEFG
jgi:transposase